MPVHNVSILLAPLEECMPATSWWLTDVGRLVVGLVLVAEARHRVALAAYAGAGEVEVKLVAGAALHDALGVLLAPGHRASRVAVAQPLSSHLVPAQLLARQEAVGRVARRAHRTVPRLIRAAASADAPREAAHILTARVLLRAQSNVRALDRVVATQPGLRRAHLHLEVLVADACEDRRACRGLGEALGAVLPGARPDPVSVHTASLSATPRY